MRADSFLDANVLVYAVSQSPAEQAKKQRALELIQTADFGVSAQVLQEFYVTVTRKVKQPITPKKALEFVQSLAKFPFIAIDAKLIEEGVALSQKYQISYWDGAVIAAAERLFAKTVYSEDLNHKQVYGSVIVVNPFK